MSLGSVRSASVNTGRSLSGARPRLNQRSGRPAPRANRDSSRISREARDTGKGSRTLPNIAGWANTNAGEEVNINEGTPGAENWRPKAQPGTDKAPQLELNQGETLRRTRYPRKSDKVSQLQEMLKAGGADLQADGLFGPKTQQAVRAFQRKHGLQVDGVVGPNTQKMLNQFSNNPGTVKPGNANIDNSDAGAGQPGATPNNGAQEPPRTEGPQKTGDQPGSSQSLYEKAFADAKGGQRTSLGRKKTLAEARRSGKDLYFRAGGAIDTDGSGPSHGDRYHQNQTSLKTRDAGYVNADKTPYFVLPPDVMRKIGAKPGDLGLIRRNGKILPAVFADVGPRGKIGEMSYTAAKQLGINPNPNTGGTHRPEVEYLVFPGSGIRRPRGADLTQAALERRVRAYLQNR